MTSKSLQTAVLSLPMGSLDAYIQRVNAIPMLTLDEELTYARAWQSSEDVAAARAMVMSHLRFVVKVAQGYKGYGLALGDLIQEGNIGLMKAVKRFDPNQGVRLVSFAVHWIKSEIHEFVLKNWRIVKIATTKAQRKLFFNLRKAKQRLGWFHKEEIAAVALALNVSTADVMEMETRLNAQDASFDGYDEDEGSFTSGSSTGGSFAPVHYLEDKRADPALMLEADDTSTQGKDKLYQALEALDERSQDILQQRWLIDKKATLQELADKYSVSPERVRQLEQNAMKKLKLALAA